MKKRLKQVFGIIISLQLLLSIFFFGGCSSSCVNQDPLLKDLRFKFETAFTEEEHIERIRARTEERLEEDIEEDKIEKIDIEIVYSFYTKDPEYFLVEVEYKEEFSRFYEPNIYLGKYTTKYKTFIGMIYFDQYIRIGEMDDFIDGPSPYKARGYTGYKKFFGATRCAIEENGKIIQIFGKTTWSYRNDYMLGLTPWDEGGTYGQIVELSKEEQASLLVTSRASSCGNWFLQFIEYY